MKGLRHIFALLLLWPIAELKAAQPAQLDFARDVRPILQHSCVKCHGAEKQKGGFRLDQPKSALGMSDSGKKIISPGKAAESELIRRVMSADLDERMPPKDGALTVADIDTLRKWIDQGAHWPESAQSAASGRAEMAVTAEDKQHWSYRPLRRVEVPSVKDATWGRNDIDRFILASLESKGLKANPQADRRTLIRRVYFDVIGLPPTPAEVDAFLADPSPDAYEKLVERLLNSPHYGERWGRHWLDVARYADSDGLETDADRPNAYQYRDFVIRALNGDLSYQTFVRWQLAGDEYEPDEAQAVAATGFLTAAPSQVLTVPMVEEQMRLRFNELDDMAATTAQAFLGLTLGCARCHDHKFDAIPTRDYYRLQAAFMTTARDEVLLGTRAQVKKYREEEARWNGQVKAAQKKLDDWLKEAKKPHATTLRHVKIDALGIKDEEKKILKEKPDSEEGRKVAKKFEKALTASEDDVRKLLGEEQRQQWDVLKKELESVQKTQPKRPAMALAITDKKPQPEPTYLLDRGNFNVKKEPVQLGFLTVLSGQRKPEEYWADAQKQAQTDRSTAQRRALADWITDTEHGAGAPLARVMVNRLWQHHFGEGLVRTVNDFGVRGELPSHPELMEWLAGDFVAGGWKLKSLHRAILTSAVYVQATTFDSQRAAIDPDNRLLWRRRPQRLEAEILRDAVLATSGTLNREQFGPAFKAPIPREAMQARNTRDPYPVDAKETPATRRRSVYMFHKRVVQHPLMQSFDAPDASVSCGRRSNTTVAPQALALLNDTFLRDRATDFARKLLAESGLKPEDWISAGFRMALGRGPSEVERIASVEFIERQMERRRAREKSPKEEEIRLRALSDFCQALFGTNEFIYVD